MAVTEEDIEKGRRERAVEAALGGNTVSDRNYYEGCTITCERMPRCVVCQDIKKPIGRSAPLGTVYDLPHCRGYREEPTPGHLWPGELADIRGEEDGSE